MNHSPLDLPFFLSQERVVGLRQFERKPTIYFRVAQIAGADLDHPFFQPDIGGGQSTLDVNSERVVSLFAGRRKSLQTDPTLNFRFGAVE